MMVDDVASLLDAEFDWLLLPSNAGIGQTANLFLLSLPDSPDSAVALYQYSGEPSLETMSNSSAVERPRLQVLVRDPEVDVAYKRAQKIFNYLRSDAFKGVSINGVFYHKITPVSSPGDIGPDTDNRHRVTTNYSVWKDTDSGD